METTSFQSHSLYPLFVRTLVWGGLFAVLYVLRSFFLLIFLTFIFAYIQAHMVVRLQRRVPNRTVATWLVGLSFLSVIVGAGMFIVPAVGQQAKTFGDQGINYLRTLDSYVVHLAAQYPVIDGLIPHPPTGGGERPWRLENSPSAALIRYVWGAEEGASGEEGVRKAIDLVRNIGARLVAITSAFLLALLFSFLIVLDLRRLSQSVLSLQNTKLRFVYLEVADNLRTFATVLGRSLEAQLVIALLNTALTAIGVYFLGLGSKMFFLAMVVFFCSFIPVAGVFISSVPICLLALEKGGLQLMAAAIVFITVIHLIEAYILNPKIFGHHLHLNPVLVLIVLTIAGKLFHVWGLVLSLPICTYLFGYAIRREGEETSPLIQSKSP